MIRIHEFDETEDLGRDPELAAALSVLDPASRDENYWFRFRWWVLSKATLELTRRRRDMHLTIGDVVESWARALVPTAALVAALAGMLLLRSEPAAEWPPITVEELLISEVENSSVPLNAAAMAFVAEIF